MDGSTLLAPHPPLTLVVGKGGAGRSTVARGLLAAARARGQRAVLVELGGGSGGAGAVVIEPRAALEDAATPVFGSRRIARAVLGNFAVARLLEILPGVHEYALLVAALELAGAWDQVIVDLPATGHGVAWLGVAARFAALVPSGRAHAQAARLDAALRDRRQTRLVAVALPEPLVLAETSELRAALRAQLDRDVDLLVVNRVPAVPDGAHAAAVALARAVPAAAALAGWLATRASAVEAGRHAAAGTSVAWLADGGAAPAPGDVIAALDLRSAA